MPRCVGVKQPYLPYLTSFKLENEVLNNGKQQLFQIADYTFQQAGLLFRERGNRGPIHMCLNHVLLIIDRLM
jgi:hypothetical protein